MNVIARVKAWATLDKFIYVWAVVVIGSNLQTLIHPHLDWVLTFLFAGLSVTRLVKERWEVPWVIVSGVTLMIASICMTALVSPHPFYDLAQAGKLAVILIAGLTFFVSRPEIALAAFRTQILLAVVNVALILIGSRISRDLAALAGRARWGTLLNVPGTLGGVGLGVLVYGLYLLCRTPRRVHGVLVVFCALALVYFENSRTITLLTLVAFVFFGAVWMYELWGSSRRVMVPSIAASIVVFVVLWSAVVALDIPIPTRFERMVELVLDEGLIAGLAESDPARARMMETAIDAVSRFPILGSGMGTLVAETRSGWMRVHMAYLQMWADAGLLAFLGYVWIAVGWMVWVPAAMRNLRENVGTENNALTYNGIFMLISLALANTLHTYSTEWAQWLPYLMSVSFLYNTAAKSDGAVGDELHGRDRNS